MAAEVDMQSAARQFFTASQFAVAGASSNPSKFGYKILKWYLETPLPATPINPSSSSIDVDGTSVPTVSEVSQLKDPKNTSLSIVTPPKVTRRVLEEAKRVGIKAVWLQPGTFDDEILDLAIKEFPGAAVGGFADGTVGGEGWCVLVDGDNSRKKDGKL